MASAKLGKNKTRCAQTAEMLRAVAHPIRLQIIAILSEEEEHVGALAKRIGAGQAIISQQLRILRAHKLVEPRRDNGFARYRLLEPRLKNLIACLQTCRDKDEE